jgi:hypothetical protein
LEHFACRRPAAVDVQKLNYTVPGARLQEIENVKTDFAVHALVSFSGSTAFLNIEEELRRRTQRVLTARLRRARAPRSPEARG